MTTSLKQMDATLLDQVRSRFAALLGAEAVLADGDLFQEFRDPFEGPAATSHHAALVIQPDSVEQVQASVQVATELGVHLWTSSMGRNYGYGGSAPVVDGAIVLNLRRMNRILEIDTRQGYAMLEPGVSFHQLYKTLREQDAPLMMSVPDLGWGSMIGNCLEHGYGYNILGDHSSALCGLEVVLANGDLIRTGQGAITNSPLWACHRRGYGPSIEEIFKQSNFGIVTKGGIWLVPRPEVISTGTILCRGDGDIVPLIDLVRKLLNEGVLQGVPMIVGSAEEPEQDQAAEGAYTYANLKNVLRPGRWNVRFAFYGHESMVNARRAILEKELAATLPEAELEMRSYSGGAGPEEVEPRDYISAGVPNQVLLERLKAVFGDGFGHMDFSPVIPLTGEAAIRLDNAVRDVSRRHGIIGPVGMLCNARSMVAACLLIFDATDPARVEAGRAAVRELNDIAASWGCAPYRSHVAMVDQVAGAFDFNDHALARTYAKIKDALDPAGILSPGNHGIWPGRAR